MRRIRQWLLTAALAALLSLSFAGVASADPYDPGMELTPPESAPYDPGFGE
jgi:hypothetical protein